MGNQEAAHDAKAKRDSCLSNSAPNAKRNGDSPHHGRNGCHDDRAKSDESCFHDGIFSAFSLFFDSIVGKVDHDDSVFQNNAHEEDEPYKRVDGEGLIE